MKCLIIAAGKGSRLSGKGDTKPLVPLLGLSLIERVIVSATKRGLSDFYVVTEYNGRNVRSFLKKPGQEGSYFRMGRDVRIGIIFLGCITNQPFITLLVIASLMNIENVRRVLALYRNG